MNYKSGLIVFCIMLLLIPTAIGEDEKVVEVTAKSTDCEDPGDNFTVTIQLIPKEDGNYSVKLEERDTKYKFINPDSGEKYDSDLKADEKQPFVFELNSNATNLDHGSTFKIGYQVLKDGRRVIPENTEEKFEYITIKVKEEQKDDEGGTPGFEITLLIISFSLCVFLINKKHKK